MITYGEISIDPAKLSQGNALAMLSRGVKHYLGNEVSARVGNEFKKAAVAKWKESNPGVELTPALREVVEKDAIPATDGEQYKAMKAAVTGEFLDTLLSGEVGVSERGSSVDPFTAEVNAIVKRNVLAILRTQKGADGKPLWSGKKDPTGETEFSFPKGVVTFADIKAKYLAKNEKMVHAEAQKELDAKARAKAKAEKMAAEGDIGDLIG